MSFFRAPRRGAIMLFAISIASDSFRSVGTTHSNWLCPAERPPRSTKSIRLIQMQPSPMHWACRENSLTTRWATCSKPKRLWWKIFCTSAEFKYGMTDARHRTKLAADQHYLDLSAKASSIALAQIKIRESAEMQFYAGMGDAFSARLYGLRGENRTTARFGVHAREHFLRAIQMDPELADAEFGLGLYNYYVDTLGGIAKLLSFFMGIPGGNKQEGIRQLEQDIAEGVLTPAAARFYLALDLHRYDQQYEKALAVIGPLVEKYPSNPLFQLARGDLYAKLSRKEQALACYRAAEAVHVEDAECRVRIQELVRASLAAQGVGNSAATH